MADIFSTRTMLRAIEEANAPTTFVLSTLFNTVEVSPSEYVDIDIVKGTRKVAPFVSPVVEGRVVASDGYTTRTYKPPYVKPKRATSAGELLKRSPGEDPYSGRSPQERAMEKLAKDLMELDDYITRREELMAVEAITTGKVVCQGDGIDEIIDFGMSTSHNVTLTGASLWSDANSDPLGDIATWARLIRKDSGINPNILIGATDAIDALLEHAGIRESLDTRRIDLGLIDPGEWTNGATYVGDLKAGGAVVGIYSYDEWYQDENGNAKAIFPDGQVVLTSTNAEFRRNFGAIQDVEAMASLMRYPKSWVTEDPSARWVMVQSAPLPAPHQIDAIVTAAVL